MSYKVDGLQYANWSKKIFWEMLDGSLDCVHATIAYHENFRETVLNLEKWNSWFEMQLYIQNRPRNTWSQAET